MSDAAIHALARSAGIAVAWRDHANKPHRVTTEALQHILAALGLPCGNADEAAESRHALETAGLPPLITATVDQPIDLPVPAAPARLTREDGTAVDLPRCANARGVKLAGIDVTGYHTIEIGNARATVAVAPARCRTIADIAGGDKIWGLAAQVYGLRSTGDCGIGDMAGVAALARKAAALTADALALSPVHALFAADPNSFSPYSPSSRLFYNPLHADPSVVFGAERVAKAAEKAGIEQSARDLEQQNSIDWPQSARAKMAILRNLFEDFFAADLSAGAPTAVAADFNRFRAAGGTMLEDHARFEALHAEMVLRQKQSWNWAQWPAQWRDPASAEVKRFAQSSAKEVTFHCFLQWITDRSLAAAQREAKGAGMRVGLISDLAVGMSGAGSHAWTRQNDILGELEIGAPPDLYNARGQNWGLTTFSPRALRAGGFAPFIATLRAALRHAGGIRIDHAMGLLRLWVVPRGAAPTEGAYLTYPIDDLMRLTALESERHDAIVVGEDLGTVPAGFSERLAETGIYGMRVLWFARERNRFIPPQSWSAAAAAMTSTHDLPTVAGWWRGTDIKTRAQCGAAADPAGEQASRAKERPVLWRAFRRAKAAAGELPPPEEASRVVDAAVRYIAQAPSDIVLLPLEDALALEDQPNLPGTIDEHPNWRRRYPGHADTLLDAPDVQQRLQVLAQRRKQ
jgi:4-alpha-glucanotransferase